MTTAGTRESLSLEAPWTRQRYVFVTPLGLVAAIVFTLYGAFGIAFSPDVFGSPETSVDTLAFAVMTFAPYASSALGLVMIGLWAGYRIGVREERQRATVRRNTAVQSQY